MNLHKDPEAFKTLLNDIHSKTSYRLDVLEKDYYVVLLLKELSIKQEEGLKAYFKGGTALYKALKLTNRFSEDIDITVDTRGLTRSQNEKMLALASKDYKELARDKGQGFSHRQEVVSVYTYNPLFTFDTNDLLQRFGKVKIEATSFTISEPYEKTIVYPLIYFLASQDQKMILENTYDVKPFNVLTSTIERIFIDKLFAAEAYTRKSDDTGKAFEVAKHIYDLSIILHNSNIDILLKDNNKMKYLLDIRIKEEQNRLDGIPGVLPKDFIFFDNLMNNDAIKNAYTIMQSQYIFQDKDKKTYTEIINDLQAIKNKLYNNKTWTNYS